MDNKTLYSIIESPTHPNFSGLYKRLGFTEIRLTSTRKANHALKTTPPAFVVAEFFYGYGNNYAGINLCNLDVFLHSLRKYSPHAKVIVMVMKEECAFVDKLAKLFPIHGVLLQPVRETELEALLN
jgi:hypothetical protein